MFPLIDESYFQFIYADYLEEQGDSLCEILRLPWFITPPALRQCLLAPWDSGNIHITTGDGRFGGYTDDNNQWRFGGCGFLYGGCGHGGGHGMNNDGCGEEYGGYGGYEDLFSSY